MPAFTNEITDLCENRSLSTCVDYNNEQSFTGCWRSFCSLNPAEGRWVFSGTQMVMTILPVFCLITFASAWKSVISSYSTNPVNVFTFLYPKKQKAFNVQCTQLSLTRNEQKEVWGKPERQVLLLLLLQVVVSSVTACSLREAVTGLEKVESIHHCTLQWDATSYVCPTAGLQVWHEGQWDHTCYDTSYFLCSLLACKCQDIKTHFSNLLGKKMVEKGRIQYQCDKW